MNKTSKNGLLLDLAVNYSRFGSKLSSKVKKIFRNVQHLKTWIVSLLYYKNKVAMQRKLLTSVLSIEHFISDLVGKFSTTKIEQNLPKTIFLSPKQTLKET